MDGRRKTYHVRRILYSVEAVVVNAEPSNEAAASKRLEAIHPQHECQNFNAFHSIP